MSMMDEVGERGLGWPLGLGLVVAAVSMGPQIAKGSRPLIKRAIKGYLAMQSRTKEMMAETGERLQDLYAEAKHEYEEEGVTTMAAAEEGKEEKAGAVAEGGKRSRSKKEKEESEEK